MPETPNTSKTSATKTKRRYVPPAITSTTAAFEHAVLACNGLIQGGRGDCTSGQFGKVGSTCVTVCTAAS